MFGDLAHYKSLRRRLAYRDQQSHQQQKQRPTVQLNWGKRLRLVDEGTDQNYQQRQGKEEQRSCLSGRLFPLSGLWIILTSPVQ